MKYFLTLIMVALFAVPASGGIITNGANTDSISFEFCIWDSTGNSTLAIASGDSVWLTVRYPNGQLAFHDSTDFDDTEIVGITSSTFSTYAWRDLVQDVDGTPVYGASYLWEVIVKDLTSAATETRSTGEFTILPNLIDMYDGTGYAGGSTDLGVNVTQISGDDKSADSLEAWTDGVVTTLMEQLQIMLDSLQLYDDWIAKEATVQIIDDTLDTYDDANRFQADIQEVLDTLQVYDDNGVEANVASMDGGVIGVGDFATGAITGDAWASSATDEIWNDDTTGHNTANSFGLMLKDTSAYQGAASGLTVDAIWDEDTTGHGTANSFAVMLKDTSAYQGAAAGITDESVAHAVLGHADSGWAADTPGNMLGDIEDYTDGDGSDGIDVQIKEIPHIADSLELYDTRFDSILANMADGAITSTKLADDITFDSLHIRTVVIKNASGTGTGLHVEGTSHGAWFRSLGTGTTALYADGSGGTNSHGLKAEGTGSGLGFGGNLSGSVGSVTGAVGSVTGDIGGLGATAIEDAAHGVWGHEADSGWAASTFGDSAKGWGAIGAGLTDANISDIADTLTNRGVTLGDGTNTACTVMVYDTDNSIGVADVRIVLDNASGAAQALGYTDSNGYIIFRLNTGTYYGNVPSNSSYTQTTSPDVIPIAANGTDTIEVTPFDPGTPAAAGTYNLYGYIYDITGTAVSGAIVTAEIPQMFWPTLYGTTLITPFKRADTTDTNGLWSIPLYQYSVVTVPSPLTDSLYYIITATEPSSGGIIGGGIFSIGYYMPTGANHELGFGGAYEKDLD